MTRERFQLIQDQLKITLENTKVDVDVLTLKKNKDQADFWELGLLKQVRAIYIKKLNSLPPVPSGDEDEESEELLTKVVTKKITKAIEKKPTKKRVTKPQVSAK